jgi:hypothetical protein
MLLGMAVLALAGCGGTSDPGQPHTGFDRTADACEHLRSAGATYAASAASAQDFETLATALGYSVEGVQDSGDPNLVTAANRMDRAMNAEDYDAIAAALPDFVKACSTY